MLRKFVGRLNYYRMAAVPDKVYGGNIGSSYQQQGLALSKQFKRAQTHASKAVAEPAMQSSKMLKGAVRLPDKP